MQFHVERRSHPRISDKWPVVVQTPEGIIEAETRNISLGGAFIENLKSTDVEGKFQLVLIASEERSILVTGEKSWCGSININGKIIYGGSGVRFVNISPEDRSFLSMKVNEHLDLQRS